MTQLEYAEQRMQQKWCDFVLAEQQGASTQVLERMYTAYVLAMESYNQCVAEQQSQQKTNAPTPFPARNKKAS